MFSILMNNGKTKKYIKEACSRKVFGYEDEFQAKKIIDSHIRDFISDDRNQGRKIPQFSIVETPKDTPVFVFGVDRYYWGG